MNKITVVIPNYNGIKYLKTCLESLYAQEEGTPDFQVVIVDNASGDGSVEQAENLFPQTEIIRLKRTQVFVMR